MDSVPQKKCSHCKCFKKQTTDFFHRDKNSKDGYTNQCKVCVRERNQRPEQKASAKQRNSRPHVIEYQREYRKSDRRKTAIKKHNDSLKVKARMKAFYATDEQKQKKREYYHFGGGKEKRHLYESKPEVRERIRAYQHTDKMRIAFKVHEQKRRAKELSLPDTFTRSDWRYALEYFHGCCAVCGRQLNSLLGDHKAAMDHWIPITSPECPGTIPTNIVPLCHGVGGCNNSKHNKPPEEWLEWKFGKRKTKVIMKRIDKFFKAVK